MNKSSKPTIIIPIPRDYFEREPLWGNAGGYRSVNEIVAAVKEAGGVPKLLYPGEEAPEFQGLILPGGGDVDPKFYGQSPEQNVVDSDEVLDTFQIELTRAALDKGLPILGICRGMQLMNVAAGGSLVQHLDSHQEHFPEEARANPDLRSLPVHSIRLSPNSILAELLDDESVDVNSLHHQAADRVADSLRVTARSDDGVVEALEGPAPFQLGVQFHPEDLRHHDQRFQELFSRLVEHAA